MKKCYTALKEKIFNLYGNKCACCGESHKEFLSIDHINNDGSEHRKEFLIGQYRGTNWTYMRHIAKAKRDDIQLLCYNCNCAKEFSGMCPHEMARREALSASRTSSDERVVEQEEVYETQ